ncbi:MAG: type II secretion system protein GspM [Pseudomonadota bacterium]
MKDWFLGLEQRERYVVGGGGVLAVLIILWGGIWLPIDKLHTEARGDVDRWQGALTDLRFARARLSEAPASTRSTPVPTTSSPVVIVDTTLRELDLNAYVTRRQPTPNGIRVEFEAVPFDQLAVWLGEMSSSYLMEVQAGNLSIASVGGPGRINASLTLERAR